jgi:hypothetical protein
MGTFGSRAIFAPTIMAATVMAALGMSSAAQALSFNDITGKWCGSVSSYTFAPGQLTVVLYSDNQPRRYKIENYQYEGDVITVNWIRDDDKLFTKFSEFSADDRLMVQLPNDAGPRREFRRCS